VHEHEREEDEENQQRDRGRRTVRGQQNANRRRPTDEQPDAPARELRFVT
jgi:hypothetical protein